MIVEFEWDPLKARINLRKHGISFEEAREIFFSPVFTAEDNRMDYGERRFISIGLISGKVIVVVIHTERKRKIRIISARKANQNERGLFYEHYKEKT